jgi:hypothetical protein
VDGSNFIGAIDIGAGDAHDLNSLGERENIGERKGDSFGLPSTILCDSEIGAGCETRRKNPIAGSQQKYRTRNKSGRRRTKAEKWEAES